MEVLCDAAIDFLEFAVLELGVFEFGVFEGNSLFRWAELNTQASSRFFGFDSFHGLVDDFANEWFVHRRGHFSTQGRIPETSDPLE